ncbi:MAG: PepSY-like domain-containing protein [Clostridiales bacterium]|nr:PepSY-like domain-containing protein [Clostridiales bacterium]
MKTHFFLIALTLMGTSLFTSCSDDDDHKTGTTVPDTYTEALKAKYPEAKNVKWERKPSYYVAEFYETQKEYDVWFGNNAQWAMTEIDYGKNLFFIPAVVSEAFAKSAYGTGYNIDDVSEYQRTDMTFYLIEVDPIGGGTDEYLYYTPDGTLLKAITQDIDITPATKI